MPIVVDISIGAVLLSCVLVVFVYSRLLLLVCRPLELPIIAAAAISGFGRSPCCRQPQAIRKTRTHRPPHDSTLGRALGPSSGGGLEHVPL